MAEYDPFKNPAKLFWVAALLVFIPIYQVIYYPLNFFVGIVLGIIGDINATLSSVLDWLLHGVSIACAVGALLAMKKLYPTTETANQSPENDA